MSTLPFQPKPDHPVTVGDLFPKPKPVMLQAPLGVSAHSHLASLKSRLRLTNGDALEAVLAVSALSWQEHFGWSVPCPWPTKPHYTGAKYRSFWCRFGAPDQLAAAHATLLGYVHQAMAVPRSVIATLDGIHLERRGCYNDDPPTSQILAEEFEEGGMVSEAVAACGPWQLKTYVHSGTAEGQPWLSHEEIQEQSPDAVVVEAPLAC